MKSQATVTAGRITWNSLSLSSASINLVSDFYSPTGTNVSAVIRQGNLIRRRKLASVDEKIYLKRLLI